MKLNGNLELSGYISGAKIEALPTLPSFSTNDEGRIVYDSTNKLLSLNNGSTYINLLTDATSNNTLISALGNNWLNSDLSFNPSPWNDFTNISGLSANSSLYDAIEKLDNAITALNIDDINNIGNVSVSSISVGDILFWNGTAFQNGTVNEIPGLIVELTVAQLSDLNITSLINNDVISYQQETNSFINKRIYFKYQNLTPNTSFIVTHNLRNQHCIVEVINTNTNQKINPNSISFDSINQLTVTLASSVPVIIVVMSLGNV